MTWQQETKIELLNQAFKGAMSSSLFSCAAGLLFTFLMWAQVPRALLLPWVILFILAQALRMGAALLKRQGRARSFHFWQNLLFIGALPSAFLWGLFPVLSFPYVDSTTRTIIAVFISTAPTAQLLSIGSVFSAWFTCSLLLLIPLSITWFFYGTPGITLGLIGFLYLGYLYAIGLKYYKLMGERIELRLQADAASKAKTTFLATASHDLRQPLHAMTMSLAAAQTLLSREEPHKNDINAAQKSLITINGLLDNLSRLLNALLDVSKIESGDIKPSLSTLPISNLLDYVRKNYTPKAHDKNLTFKVMPCHLKIQSDPIYLQRIISHIVSNSIRHTKKGRILVGCKRSGDYLLIQIIDTGPGIPPKKFRNLFNKFNQLDTQIHHKNTNHALGLAITDRIARSLGHELSATSLPGRGTSFCLKVPLNTQEHALNDIQPLISKKTGKRRAHLVVLIHPQNDVLEETAVQIRNWGYRVLAFQTTEEAQCLQIRPQIIIAAQRLPNGLNGFEGINILRGTWKINPPGLVLVSDTSSETIREAHTYHCQTLPSPPDPTEFKDCLQESVKGEA